jgi:hypothetical protein
VPYIVVKLYQILYIPEDSSLDENCFGVEYADLGSARLHVFTPVRIYTTVFIAM